MRKQHDVLSVEWIKLELIRAAYATRGGVFTKMDPRVVVLWYLVLAITPWFTHNLTVLAGFFALGIVSVILARVGPLLLGLFVMGKIVEAVYLFVIALFFGGDMSTVIALAELTLKLGAISLASMAAFVSLDPEKLSDAMLSFKMPQIVAFGVSYGYRMLPILIDQFATVFEGYRLRSAPVPKRGILGWRLFVHWCRIAVLSFYPIFLNTAKSVRTTVESLETRGFTYATVDARGRQLRLAYLRVGWVDITVVGTTVILLVGIFLAGNQWPWYR